MSSKPLFVVFHGYNGGVGRSSALTNVALLLANKGYRVLAWDLALNTPNLEDFEPFQSIARSSLGFLSLTTKAIDQTLKFKEKERSTSQEKQKKTGQINNIKEFLEEILEKMLEAAIVKIPQEEINNLDLRGQLYLLPAFGKFGAEALSRASSIDWQSLYTMPDELGYVFWEKIKKAIMSFNCEYRGGFDYVLIDAESGYSILAKIAILQLADMVVYFSRATTPNIKRTAESLQLWRLKRQELQFPALEEILAFSFVEAGVDWDTVNSKVEERLVRSSVTLPLFPSILHSDQPLVVAPRQPGDYPLRKAYEVLAMRIISGNPHSEDSDRYEADLFLYFQQKQGAAVFLANAYQQYCLGRNPVVEQTLSDGAKWLEKEGIEQEKTNLLKESHLLASCSYGLKEQDLVSMVKALAGVKFSDSWPGLLKVFVKEAVRQKNGVLLERLANRLVNLLADNPWFWASYFATREFKNLKVGDPLFEKALDFTVTYLLCSAELPLPEVISRPGNPYRPWLDFRPEDVELFQGRENIIKNLFLAGRCRCMGIQGLKGSGKTWILQALQAMCGDPTKDQQIAALHRKFGIDNITPKPERLPLHSVFVEGIALARSIEESKDPYDIALGLRKAINTSGLVSIRTVGSLEDLAKEIQLDEAKATLKDTMLLIDDFDQLFISPWQSRADKDALASWLQVLLDAWPGTSVLTYESHKPFTTYDASRLAFQITLSNENIEALGEWARDFKDFSPRYAYLSQIHSAKWGEQEWRLTKEEIIS